MTKDIESGLKFITAFRELDPEIPMTTAAVFLTVAGNEGMTMKDLANKLHISQASCSRNVAYLSKFHRLEKPGLDLIVATEDPAERRRKIMKLTARGKRFLDRITDIIK